MQVIYTPGLEAPGYPDDRVIAVDLDNYVTRVLHSDYFGESKKGGLRMWNDIVYNKGGLALHAGLKVIPTADGDKVFMIIGLSGTGKTTTTFTTQNGSLPIQDDFVGLMPGGHAYGTENGCFAKTFGLDPDFEPSIHGAVVKPTTYMENVFQDDAGVVDFNNEGYTKNGRAVFSMDDLLAHGDARDVGTVDYLLILNRNENIIPAVSKLNQEQAAAFFMLGETTGTSAGGAAEEGKFLRVPGTNPFFPLPHGLQGNRLLELLATHPIETYLLNTGRVGGKDDDERSKKLRIPDTSACVKGIAEQTITFDEDPDFGYQVAASVPGPRRRGEAAAPPALRAAGPGRRVRLDGRAAQERSGRPPAAVHPAERGDHQGRRLSSVRTHLRYPPSDRTRARTGAHRCRPTNTTIWRTARTTRHRRPSIHTPGTLRRQATVDMTRTPAWRARQARGPQRGDVPRPVLAEPAAERAGADLVGDAAGPARVHGAEHARRRSGSRSPSAPRCSSTAGRPSSRAGGRNCATARPA